jgi:hypothetical protein
MINKALAANIRLMFGASSMASVQQGMRNLVGGLKNVQVQADKVDMVMNQLANTANSFNEIGAAMVDPFKELSANYVSRMGMMEATSARWIQSTIKMEQAQLKLGRAATKALQPMQDKLVAMIEKLADFIQQNPQLLNMAINVGGAMMAAGAAMAGISKAIMMINQMRQAISGMGMAGQALGAAGIIGAGAIFAPGIGGAAGKGISQAMANMGLVSDEYNKAVQAQEDTWSRLGKQLLQISYIIDHFILQALAGLYEVSMNLAKSFLDMATNLNPFLSDEEKQLVISERAERASEKTEEVQTALRNIDISLAAAALGAMSGGGAAGGPVGIDAAITQDMLNQYEMFLFEQAQELLRFEKQVEQQEAEHKRQMTIMQDDYDRQRIMAEEDFARDQRNSIKEQNRSLALMERDYRIEAGRAVEEYNIEEMRRQKDFNLERQRAEMDHRKSILDAAARLDALAIIQEQRQFAIDDKRARQDFDKETKRNQENFDLQQRIANENFRRQRDDQIKNFNLQQQLATEQFNIQQSRARREFEMQKSRAENEFKFQQDMQQRQFDLERAMREVQNRKQIEMQLRQFTMTEQQAEQHYAALRAGFLATLGYMEDGIRDLGEGIDFGGAVSAGADFGIAAGTGGSGGSSSGSSVNIGGEGYYPPGYNTSLSGGGYTVPAKKRTSGSIMSFAEGGYTGSGGLSYTHPGEFVLNRATTKSLEDRLGGTLSQSKISGGVLGGIQAQISNVFNDVGTHSIDALAGMVEKATRGALIGILEDYNKA